jgi:hypothetical protein
MKIVMFSILLICYYSISAQELFVVTEPASNMPAKTWGIRVMNSLMKEGNKTNNFHTMPELMWGANKNLMVHGQFFLSTRANEALYFEGGSLYAKYRFYSVDDLQKHFRMAYFLRTSINRADIHQEEIETMGHNTGFETGLIATQLLHKTAISSSISLEKIFNNTKANKLPTNTKTSALNFSISGGQLLLPKVYTSYKQINMNFMVEALGQQLLGTNKKFIDIIPSLQFIFNSQARLDIAYRKELYSNMLRTAPDGFILKLEYQFFNTKN